MEIRRYQIINFKSLNLTNRIINEIIKDESIFNATIDKSTRILTIQCTPPMEKYKEAEYYKKLEQRMTNAIKTYEKKASLKLIEDTPLYRKVLYLNGLDCAYCATRVENLAKKEFNHERIVVDYPTARFIIETRDKDLIDDIEARVKSVAHRVDERIVVTIAENNRSIDKDIVQIIKKPSVILIFIGLALFIAGVIIAYNFHDIIKSNYVPENLWGVAIIIAGYLLIGHRIIIRFFKNLFRANFLDENFLMTVASIGALITNHFVEAAAIMALYQMGEFLQNIAVKRTRKSIAELLRYEVQTCKVRVGTTIAEMGVEGVLIDDVVIVGKGEMVPVDGVIAKGKTFLDTKNITGESVLRQANIGDEVLSGSINVGNVIEIRVLRTYNNSMMTRILDLVENATTNKAKAENFISKFSKYYTPIVVGLASFILAGGILYSVLSKTGNWYHWVYVASEFLVISCPCALVISIPLSFFCAIGAASKRGILIRGSNYLEALYNIENIVFDKTGTLTKGDFQILNCVAEEGFKPSEVRRLFLYTEYYSSHPIGKSIVDAEGRMNFFTDIISDFQQLQGGARAVINGSHILIANEKLVKKEKLNFKETSSPNLVIYVFKDKTYMGYVEIGDTVREEAYQTIVDLRGYGVSNVVMMTGDSKGIADYVANNLQLDEAYAELLPDQKVDLIENIKAESKRKNSSTIYVGDGVNDAPVIASSDVGIAMGDTASDATISIADVVIMTNDLHKLVELHKLAIKTRHKVVENIIFTLSVKLVVMFVALFYTKDTLPLWLAIFSDVGVSMLAILNSIRMMFIFGKGKKIDQGEKANDEE